MKRNILYLIVSLFTLLPLQTSCKKDLGNYTYSRVDTLNISNIDTAVHVTLGGNPEIFPQFSSVYNSIDTSSDQFSYKWIAYNLNAISSDDQVVVLDTTKNLNKSISLLVGSYPTYYQVTQKSTGITWQFKFTLNVDGTISKPGWFILCQIGDSSQLNYFQDSINDWNTFPYAYKNINKLIADGANPSQYLTIPGKPKSLASYYNRDYVNTSYKYYEYINTDQVTRKLNITDGFVWNSDSYLFRNECILSDPYRADYIIPHTASASTMLYNNNFYTYFFTGSIYYNTAVNKLSSGGVFPVSEYVATPYSTGATFYTMLFDTLNRRFVKFGGSYSTKSCTVLSFPNGAFNPNAIGKDLVWLGWTPAFSGQAIAIMKDTAASNYYLARFTFTNTGTLSPISLTDVTSKLTGIANATHFAIDQQYGYIFYVSGGQLYEYDMDNDILNIAMSLNGKSVSMLKTERLYSYKPGSTSFNNTPDRWYAVGYSIILGLYDSNDPDNSGEVHFLKPGALMTDVTEYFTPFTGIAKPVDVNYIQL